MANQTKNDKEVVKDTQSPTQIDNTEIMKMMLDFQEQLNIMKEQNSLLQVENESLKNKASTLENKDDFDPNKLVTIINNYLGLELNLKIDDYGKIRTHKKFGGTFKIRLIEAKDIVRLNQSFAEKGYFIFTDRELVAKEFDDLIEYYDHFIDNDVLKHIYNLPVKTLVEIFKNANLNYQKAIVDSFINGWVKGEIIEFRDQNKINTLSEIAEIDIMSMINNVGIDENLKNEYMKS